MTLYPDPPGGEPIGRVDYEASSWSCSYDLLLRDVRDGSLVLTQRLTTGSCPEDIQVVLTRQGELLRAEWLQPDQTPLFGALFVRSR